MEVYGNGVAEDHIGQVSCVYRQRLRNEERGKTLAAFVAIALIVWLLIAVYRASA